MLHALNSGPKVRLKFGHGGSGQVRCGGFEGFRGYLDGVLTSQAGHHIGSGLNSFGWLLAESQSTGLPHDEVVLQGVTDHEFRTLPVGRVLHRQYLVSAPVSVSAAASMLAAAVRNACACAR